MGTHSMRPRFPFAIPRSLLCLSILAATNLGTASLQAADLPASPSRPLPQAHAHNDYAHSRPLLDALDHGFCSVEADIHLVDTRLLVAHDAWQVKPGRTLQALYLDPLRHRIRANGGRVHRDGPVFSLLIDLKTPAEPTYAALRKVLADYSDILTRFEGDQIVTNAVLVVLSGNRPRETLRAEKTRFAACDGRLTDLDSPDSPALLPWISDSWGSHFTWKGLDPIPADERAKLRSLVERIHRSGRKVRFWGAPDREIVWREWHAAGVDLLNTDRLADLQQFLLAIEKPQ